MGENGCSIRQLQGAREVMRIPDHMSSRLPLVPMITG